tara:strand:- start:129 stop:560 length:432 start_codon:yes stop_codon:yes gene_type:complete
MRNLLIIVLLFSISSCLVSNSRQHNEKKEILSLKSSPCKGNCHVYKITFYSDGIGIFNDIKNKRQEYFKYSISDLDKIILYSKEIKFSEVKNKYFNRGLQDLVVKTIVINGHSVKYNENPSLELRELCNKILLVLPADYQYLY